MEEFILLLGDILMFCLAVFSIFSAAILVIKILKSQELKDKKDSYSMKKNLCCFSFLLDGIGIVVPKKFMKSHRNAGPNPCSLQNLVIEDIYLTEKTNVIFNDKGADYR